MNNYTYFLILLITIFSCSTSYNTPQKNFSTIRETKTNIMTPSLVIYNPSLDSSIVYFKIPSKDLLYARKDKVSPYKARIKIDYKLYPYGNSKLILDSSTYYIEDIKQTKHNNIISGNIPIRTQNSKDFLLKITTKDLNRDSEIEKDIYIRKSYVHNRQYFIVLKDSIYTPIYDFFINDSSNLILKSEINKNKKVTINYYNRNFNIAPPPFASINTKPFNYTPDTIIEKQFNKEGITYINPPKNGFIHIQTDTSSKAGYTLFKYENNFPNIQSINELIKPLRYICSTEEYNNLLNSKNPKKSVDEFWLSKASSEERARELIKQYYNRVERANKYFSSYIEGWKTDRGMISIVFGQPTTIRKVGNTETWIYGEENNLIALSFIFNKKNNYFSNNDFKLQRSSTYKTNWYRAVDIWRSGRVYYGN